MKNKILSGVFAIIACAVIYCTVFAAPDYDNVSFAPPFRVVTVVTGSVKNITIGTEAVTIVHTGFQNDGVTPSAATDKVIVMCNRDQTGTAVTMTADLTDGVKLPIFAGGSATFVGSFVYQGIDVQKEIQIQAVGNGAKLIIIRGRDK